MNLKRGVNRIALVLSALWFVFFFGVGIVVVLDEGWESDTWPILLFIFLGPIAVWFAIQVAYYTVYYTGLFIVRGFRDEKPKDEQSNK